MLMARRTKQIDEVKLCSLIGSESCEGFGKVIEKYDEALVVEDYYQGLHRTKESTKYLGSLVHG
jgi:tRNA isopentenyl-2-thiomethyl-A-37 hydroxylase MiaE